MRRRIATALALAATVAVAVAVAAGGAAPAPGCRQVAAPKPKPDGGRKPPTARLDPRKTYRITLATNCGSFTITLDVRHAPRTTASFVSLVKSGFYAGTVFHRIVPGFVIQGGDPTGTGMGGPGYLTVDTPAQGTRYTRGVVAMAKTQTEPAGTAGSQFFVVTADQVALPPDYAVLGRVSSGLDVVNRIGVLGDPATEKPTQVVEIQRATVKSS